MPAGHKQARSKKNPPVRYNSKKTHPLSNRISSSLIGEVNISLVLPVGGYELLISTYPSLSEIKKGGLAMVASLLWKSRKRNQKSELWEMKVTKACALAFVDRIGNHTNPVTMVAKAWGCELLTKGQNMFGKVTNVWLVPDWAKNNEKRDVRLTKRQRENWRNRTSLLTKTSDRANPHAAVVRRTLAVTKASPDFRLKMDGLFPLGERQSAETFLAKPIRLNITRDNDVQSTVSRLPSQMRRHLLIEGRPVVELDVKGAHATLLAMYYEGEKGEKWEREKTRFREEAQNGFVSIYGSKKEWKIGFLSALNQKTYVARHASPGYVAFEKQFPLLAGKIAEIKSQFPKVVGDTLRRKMAEIMQNLILKNDGDGIPTIPVIDSAIIPIYEDALRAKQAMDLTAYRLAKPIAEATGIDPIIECSNGMIYQSGQWYPFNDTR
jgi:hypothetical protein